MGIGVLSSTAKMIAAVGPETPEGQRLIRRIFAVLRDDLLFMFAIVFAMVVEPTSDDAWVVVVVAAVLVGGALLALRPLASDGRVASPVSRLQAERAEVSDESRTPVHRRRCLAEARHRAAQIETRRPAGSGSVAAAATAAATAAARARREARLGGGTVDGERGELPQHLCGAAARAGHDLLLGADELLEVLLALHARVLVDRHQP